VIYKISMALHADTPTSDVGVQIELFEKSTNRRHTNHFISSTTKNALLEWDESNLHSIENIVLNSTQLIKNLL